MSEEPNAPQMHTNPMGPTNGNAIAHMMGIKIEADITMVNENNGSTKGK